MLTLLGKQIFLDIIKDMRWEIIPYYWKDLMESHWSLKVEELSQLWVEGNQRTEDGERDATLLGLKMEEGDLEPKNEDNFKKLKKARKWILSQSLQKELRTANIFSHTSHLQWPVLHFWPTEL